MSSIRSDTELLDALQQTIKTSGRHSYDVEIGEVVFTVRANHWSVRELLDEAIDQSEVRRAARIAASLTK